MAYCRVLLCNINKKLSCCNGGFLFISNKHLVTFHFSLAIYPNCTKAYSNFSLNNVSPMPIIFLMTNNFEYDFCLFNILKLWKAVFENCLVVLRFSKNLNALLFRCVMNVSSRTRLRVGFRCFKGHLRSPLLAPCFLRCYVVLRSAV